MKFDVFVFESVDGAKKFYEFMKDERYESDLSGIRDEATFYSSGTSTYGWVVRDSNAPIRVIVWDG